MTPKAKTSIALEASLKAPLLLLCTLAVLALSASPAFASRPHEFTGGFGSKCIAQPCTGESIKRPSALAVNEESGDIYVLDEGEAGTQHGRVAVFEKDGTFVSEFDGSGTLLNGKGETFEGTAAGSGGKTGEIETGRFEGPQAIAIDNSCVLRKLSKVQCEAEDPSDGDVYVLDSGHRVVDKYTPGGEYLGQITEAGSVPLPNRAVEGVAVDPSGTVWVYRQEAGAVIDRFSNANPNVFVAPEIAPNALGGQAALGLAVDANGNFYGRVFAAAFPQVVKWSPAGAVLIEELGSGENSAVAVEQTNGNALIDNLTSVGVFSSEGSELERLGEENSEAHLLEGAGLSANALADDIYVGENSPTGAHAVVEFGPAAAGPPKVEDGSESFSSVTDSEVSLSAEVNPRGEVGEALGNTEYSFEYGICAQPSDCAASGYQASVPQPAGQLAAGFEPQKVAAHLSGLQPSTTYHFRLTAKNGHGAGQPGAEVSFTTEPLGGPRALPDGRGYELVSPPDKQGALVEPLAQAGVVQAAASGQAITYLTNAPTEAQPKGLTNKMQVLSRRGASSWSSSDIGIPHSSATGLAAGPGPEYKFFTPELTLSALQPFGEFIPQLSAEASESTAYLHDLSESCASNCFRPLVTGKEGFANVPAGTEFGEEQQCKAKVTGTGSTEVACGPQFVGGTADLSHVVLKSAVPLGSGTVVGELYEWSAGALAPVSVLPGPGGAAVEGNLGLQSQAARNAISSDGNRIVWSSTSALYLRDMARGETLQLDRAEEVGGVPCSGCVSGDGQFQIASSDGSRVFFTDTNRLSEDSGAESAKEKADLYECQIVIDSEGKLHCDLTDLTPARGIESAEDRGGILGAGEAGEQLYFVAKGIQSGANSEGNSPVAGQPNLYVHEASGNQLIATLASGENGDEHDWFEVLIGQPTRVSSDGRYLEFMSQAPLRGYDNRDVASGDPAAEVYIYDASAKQLRCASCMPSGQRPIGVEYHKLESGLGGLVGGHSLWPEKALVAANVAGWTAIGEGVSQKERYQPRYLSNEGRLFFNTADALVPQDANGTQDVYEYEPPGVGSCTSASETFSERSGGCVSLISSGASTQESAFLDASAKGPNGAEGEDVFFLTSAQLSPLDVDASVDVYDAHVCSSASPCITYGGVQSPPCTTEASCKASPSPQPSIFGAPSSATFQGPGNLAPAAAVKAKAKPLTRAQKLARALKACHTKKSKRKRQACEKTARKNFGPVKAKQKKAKR